jgi:hypothetical protein
VAAPPGAGFGRVLIECQSCGHQTPVTLLALGPQLIPSIWVPLRRYPVLMRCPGCHRLAWCRINWAALLRL